MARRESHRLPATGSRLPARSGSRSSSSPKPQAPSPFSLPLFGIGAGLLWLLLRSNEPRGGKEWRGYSGTVALKPAVVYRFEFLAPASASIDRTQVEEQLSRLGAKNFLWNLVPDGTHLYFDQSFPEGATLTFGKSNVGPLSALTARRLDGLDWEAP